MLSYPDISRLSLIADKISNLLQRFKLLITTKSERKLYQLLSDSAIIILIMNFSGDDCSNDGQIYLFMNDYENTYQISI